MKIKNQERVIMTKNRSSLRKPDLRKHSTEISPSKDKKKSDDGKVYVSTPKTLPVYSVAKEDRIIFNRLVDYCILKYPTEDNHQFLNDITPLMCKYLYGTELFDKIYSFKFGWLYSDIGILKIVGLFDINQNTLGETPEDYCLENYSKSKWFRFANVLIHGGLGTHPMTWLYQRPGTVHSVIQRMGFENSQTGSGTELLHKHTEDAPLRSSADFVTFCFLRNFEESVSSFSSIRSIEDLHEKWYFNILFDGNFKYPADANYEPQPIYNGGGILFGNRQYPKIRFDPIEQIKEGIGHSKKELEALADLSKDLEEVKINDIPEAGDIYLINNKLALHYRGKVTPGIMPNGQNCERRWMMRTMSVESFGFMQEFSHPENPRLIIEKGFGKLFSNEELQSVNLENPAYKFMN